MYQGAVFFDYDGTLVDETYQISSPTSTTLSALAQLKKNGYLVSLCTGRAKNYVPQSISFDFDCYITSNGACAEIQNQVIYNNSMDSSLLIHLAEFFKTNEMNFLFETREKVYCYNLQEELFHKMINRYKIPLSYFSQMERFDYSNVNKIIITFNQEEKLQRFQTVFGSQFDVVRQHENPFSCDISKKGISKAYGIQAVIDHLGLNIKDTYAFGDGDNDLSMFQVVGTGIAMKNHAPCLKPYLTYVTGSAKEEGIYHGLKRYQLI